MPRLSLTRHEIDVLTALCALADAAGTELDAYEALDEGEQQRWFPCLESAWRKLADAREPSPGRSPDLARCPDCGALIATRFPVHVCK